MSEYEIKTSGMIFRRRDEAWIPPVANNADYQAFLNWLAAGNVPDEEQPAAQDPPA